MCVCARALMLMMPDVLADVSSGGIISVGVKKGCMEAVLNHM